MVDKAKHSKILMFLFRCRTINLEVEVTHTKLPGKAIAQELS